MKICFCEQGGLVSLCCSSGDIFWNFMPTGEAKPAHACTVLDYSVKMICQSKKRHKIASWDSAKAVCSPNNTNRSSLTTHKCLVPIYLNRGEGEQAGKANWSELLEHPPTVSIAPGIPGDVPTVSLVTSSGSRMKSSSWEISVT